MVLPGDRSARKVAWQEASAHEALGPYWLAMTVPGDAKALVAAPDASEPSNVAQSGFQGTGGCT